MPTGKRRRDIERATPWPPTARRVLRRDETEQRQLLFGLIHGRRCGLVSIATLGDRQHPQTAFGQGGEPRSASSRCSTLNTD